MMKIKTLAVVLLLVIPLISFSGCIDIDAFFGKEPFVGTWGRSDGRENVTILSDGTGTTIGQYDSYSFTWVRDKETMIWTIHGRSPKVVKYYTVNPEGTIIVFRADNGTPWAYIKGI